jgi:pilus assembly protein CpaB
VFAIDKSPLIPPFFKGGRGGIFLLACGSAILAGLLGWLFLHHLEWTYQEAGETVPVLVASRYVPRGTPLRPAYFQRRQIPKSYVEPGALMNYAVLESSPGRPLFRSPFSIPEGTQLVQRELVPLTEGAGLSQTIPDNQVAVSFGVDHVRGLGGNLQPGDLIDVLHTPRGGGLDPKPRPTTPLLQAVPVIAVGKKWISPGQETMSASRQKEERAEKEDEETSVLTVLLNPLAAVRLAEARENETLSVILRARGNDRIQEDLP